MPSIKTTTVSNVFQALQLTVCKINIGKNQRLSSQNNSNIQGHIKFRQELIFGNKLFLIRKRNE